MSRNQFGSTEGIGKRRIENEAQRLGEEDISETIQEAHRFALHWVYQTGPVNEVGEALAIRFVETSEHLGGHGQIRIQNCQQISGCVLEAQAHGVVFAFARLLNGPDSKTSAVLPGNPLNLLPCPVVGMAFDKQDL